MIHWKDKVRLVVAAYQRCEGRDEKLEGVTPEELFEYLEANYPDYDVATSDIDFNGWEGDWNTYMADELVVGGCWWTGHMYILCYARSE